MTQNPGSGTGLVQQTVQVVASLRLHDLTLIVSDLFDVALIRETFERFVAKIE